MVGQIVAVLVVLLFLAALYMSSKNWRIPHVLLLFGIFAATATFVVFAAMSLKTHEGWRKKHAMMAKQIETTNASIALLEVGDQLDPASTPDTIPRLEKRLALQMVGRGRVWRGVTPAGAAGASVAVDMTGWGGNDCYGKPIADDEELEPEPDPVVEEPVDVDPVDADAPTDPAADAIDGGGAEFGGAEQPDGSVERAGDAGTDPTADPAADPAVDGASEENGDAFFDDGGGMPAGGAAPAGGGRASGGGETLAHGIETGAVVYAFLEGSSRELPPAQQKALFGASDLPKKDLRGACRVPVYYLGSFVVKGAQGNSLALEPVIQLDREQTRLIAGQQGTWTLFEVMPVDGHDLAEAIPAAELPGLFPNSPFGPAIVAEYARDMQSAAAGDSAAQTLVKVKILKEHVVNVDTEEVAQAMEGSFDKDGRAVLSYLMQGAPTTLSEGDELHVLGETAAKWAGEGICERAEGDPVFVRPLRNYDIIFHRAVDQATRVTGEMGVFTKDNETVTTAAGKAKTQIEFRENEIGKIKEDQGYLSAELDLLSRYRARVEKLYSAQRKALSGFYRGNSQSADALRGPVQVSNNR